VASLKVEEAFSWALQDPSWRAKIAIQGLILLIPVVGVIALLGWMLANLENVREGRYELARNGLYLVDGVEMFAVCLIYFVVLGIPYAVLTTIAANVPPNPRIYLLAEAANLAGLLALGWLMPAMIVATDREGFLVGVGPLRLLRESSAHLLRTSVAAVLMVAAFLLGLAGLFICLVGALVTLPYAATVLAAIAAWWERPGLPRAPVPADRPVSLGPSAAPVGPARSSALGRLPPVAPPPPSLLRPGWLPEGPEADPAPPVQPG